MKLAGQIERSAIKIARLAPHETPSAEEAAAGWLGRLGHLNPVQGPLRSYRSADQGHARWAAIKGAAWVLSLSPKITKVQDYPPFGYQKNNSIYLLEKVKYATIHSLPLLNPKLTEDMM